MSTLSSMTEFASLNPKTLSLPYLRSIQSKHSVTHGVMKLDRDTDLTQHRESSDCVVIPPLKYPSVLDTSLVFKDW